MNQEQIVTNFVLYEGEEILCQCSFQSLEREITNGFYTTDGGIFKVAHSYRATVCNVEVMWQVNEDISHFFELEIPINRTKRKWQTLVINEKYKLFYCSVLERLA